MKSLRTSGLATARTIAALSLAAIASGRPRGASTPNQTTLLKPGTSSLMAGRPGSTSVR